MKPVDAPVGAKIVDSLPFSRGGTGLTARAMAAAGVNGVALYLGAAGPVQVAACLEAGLGMIGVTFGGAYNGAAAVAQAKALGLPTMQPDGRATPIALDLEGEVVGQAHAAVSYPRSQHRSMIPLALHVNATVDELIQKIVAWASPVKAAGYMPILYVGVPQPFTSSELWKLPVVRYWKGQGLARDRFGNGVEPDHAGWTLTQAWPSVLCGGVLVDFNQVSHDYAAGGRSLPWAVSD